jgi:PAS domain S-box-containing protein
MRTMKTSNREIGNLALIVALTIGVALLAVCINITDRVYGFLNFYSKLDNFQLYANVVLLYLAGLIWLIYRGWIRALRRQDELEDIILSIHPDVLLVVDEEDRILMCNGSVTRMFDYTAEEMINQKTDLLELEAISETESGRGFYSRVEKEGFFKGLGTGKKKNGETVPLELIVVRLRTSTGKVLLLQDISERKKAEEEIHKLNDELEERVRLRTAELHQAYSELKELDKTKDAFLSSVSHELRTPLTSIRSFSEILLHYDDHRPETLEEFLAIINRESERLTRLIDDIMDLAKIDARKMEWTIQRLVPVAVVRKAAEGVRGLLLERGLDLEIDIPAGLPTFEMDEDRILQVLSNLLGNAIKFTPRGGRIHIQGACEEEEGPSDTGGSLHLLVADTGVGIPPEELPLIFERFRQVGDTLTDKPKGTGLGLSICREILTCLGGRIWAESVPGVGSTFHVVVPVNSHLQVTAGERPSGPEASADLLDEDR